MHISILLKETERRFLEINTQQEKDYTQSSANDRDVNAFLIDREGI